MYTVTKPLIHESQFDKRKGQDMRVQVIFCLILMLITLIAGCGYYSAPVTPMRGAISVYEVPVDHTFDNTRIGYKRGEAGTTVILGLFSFGDASTYRAAQNANIHRVDHIDHAYLNVLGLFTKYTTIVYGE